MKIVLQPHDDGNCTHSIENGKHDGKRNFDHHGPFAEEICPANNNDIQLIFGLDANIGISHIDADTVVGLARMLGQADYLANMFFSHIDLNLLEEIDINGSSVVPVEELTSNPTLLYMVGVGQLCNKLQFPFKGPTDVTDLICDFFNVPPKEVIEMGREATMASEVSYVTCKIPTYGTIGLWSIGKDQPFDPSRPYRDGYEIVLIYREDFKSISVYGNAESLPKGTSFPGTWAGIEFQGHPMACGSPRDEEFTLSDAVRVMEALI